MIYFYFLKPQINRMNIETLKLTFMFLIFYFLLNKQNFF